MFIFDSINLVFFGLVVFLIGLLGILIYTRQKMSATARAFLFCTSTTVLWSIFNFLTYTSTDPKFIMFFLRLGIISAAWNIYSVYLLVKIFPDKEYHLNRLLSIVITFFTFFVSILGITDAFFVRVTEVNQNLTVKAVENGKLIPIFGLFVVGMLVLSLVTFYKKINRSDETVKKQEKNLLTGISISFSCIILFNFIFPAILNNSTLVPWASLFLMPFIISIAVAIIKNNLLDIKVIASELVVYSLWFFLCLRMLIASSLNERIINGLLFLVVLILGEVLIRSVLREVKQRERLEILTNELEIANDKLKSLDKLKTEFLSLASHQLRSPLTAIKGYTSMLLEGSFGEVNANQKEAIDRVFQSVQHLTKVVEDLLNVSKIEQGGMKYEMAPFDLAKNVKEIADDLSITAKNKGLTLTYESDSAESYVVNGDMEKIRQVILNLIDNSIKYTKEGWIKVKVENDQTKKVIRTSVSDSGMGMTEEIKNSLFQKFSRGEGGKVNTGGSGLGLYLAKQIVEAHKGRVWVESPGPGKGSTFIVEFPTGIN